MCRLLIRMLAVFLLITFESTAVAVDLRKSDYAVFEKAGNRRGKIIYVVPKENILMLYGDIITPITYMPDIPAYVFMAYHSGASGLVQVARLNANDLASNPSYTLSSFEVTSFDFSGDGDTDILLRNTVTRKSYILIDTGTPSILAPPSIPGSMQIPSEIYAANYPVSWGASTGHVQHYKLFEQTETLGAWSLVATVNDNISQLTNRAAGPYSYKVQACNGAGCSDFNTVKTSLVKYVVPSTITVSNNNEYGKFTLSWKKPTSQVWLFGYFLEEKIDDIGWQLLHLVDGTVTTTLRDRLEGTHAFRMTNCQVAGCVYEEPTVVVVKHPVLPQVPGVIQSDVNSPTLTWGASSVNVGTYLLEQRVGPNGSWKVVQVGLKRVANIAIYEKAVHYYRVQACNANGCSGYTQIHTVNATTNPTFFNVDKANSYDGNYTLSWTFSSVDRLEQKLDGGDWQVIALPAAGTSKTISSTAGTYFYRMRLRMPPPSTFVFYSNIVRVNVILPPLAPTGLRGPNTDLNGHYTLHWNAVAQADYYILEQQKNGVGGWAPVANNGQLVAESKKIIGRESGVYRYRVNACNSAGCSAYSALHTVTINSAVVSQPNNVAPYVLPAGDNNVGAIGGSYEVGADGSATFSIPIASAPGVGGLQPTFALNYNSGSGNGEVGVGWSISGLSTLHRCATTLTTDGFVDPVDFDDNDKYCLDGKRLVGVSGEYGADLTEYRTEFESFSDIKSLGSEGTYFTVNGVNSPYPLASGSTHNPESFVVTTPDGRTIEYGNTVDSRLSRSYNFISCNNTVTDANPFDPVNPYNICGMWTSQVQLRTYQWMISKITDRYNNTIVFTYFNADETGEQRIKDVVYNGGKTKISFEYEPRPDVARGYFAGGVLQQGERLKRVLSYSDVTVLRMFELSYDTTGSTGDSRLVSIEECTDQLKTQCLKPTLFSWQLGESGFDIARRNYVDNTRVEARPPIAMDVNGDGRVDFVSSANANWQITLGNGENFDAWIDTGIPVTSWEHAHPLDYNGDGKTDLLIVDGKYWKVLLSSGVGFFEQATATPSTGFNFQPRIMDINGDGRSDLVYIGINGLWHIRLMTDNGFGPAINSFAAAHSRETTLVGDINGDGLQDMFVPHKNTWLIYFSTGNGFRIVDSSVSTLGYDDSANLMDVNGDGLVDLVSAYDLIWVINLNQGGRFGPAIRTSFANHGYQNVRVTDVNNDGRSDLVYYLNQRWHVLRSTGEGFVAGDSIATIVSVFNKHTVFADLEGNGLNSMVEFWDDVYIRRHLGERPDYMTSVTNGIGVVTTFEYNPLNDDKNIDLYGRGPTTFYPLIAENSGDYVVSKVTQSNDVGGVNAVSYQYRERRLHVGGYGSLGFRKFTTINNDTGIRTETTFSQDYANRQQGSIEKVETIAPSGVVLSSTENNAKTVVIVGASLNRYLHQVTQTRVTQRDLNGSFLSREISDYEYDSYSNPTKITNTLYDENDAQLRVNETVSTYHNDSYWGLFGLLTRMASSTTVTGSDAVKKLVTVEYNIFNGRKLVDYVRHPDTEVVLLETRYGEDAAGVEQLDTFGNVKAITVKGPDIVTRDTSVVFDVTGRFALSKTNEAGQTVTYVYYADNEYGAGAYPGKVKLATDANNISTHFSYDSYGRTTQVIAAYNTLNPVTSYTRFEWCGSLTDCRYNSVYRLIQFTAGGTPSITEIDRLGRTVSQSSIAMNGVAVNVDYEFDHIGRNIAVTEPYFDSEQAYWNMIEYDILGRPVKSIEPDGRIDSVAYNGLSTTGIIDVGVKNQTKTEVKSAIGELIAVTDTQNKTINYQYDSAGQQTAVTDPDGNQISIVYDVFGRKVSMTDPDKGTWAYTYNSLGQMITQANANLEVTCLAYDMLGRMIKRIDGYTGGALASAQCAGDETNTNVSTWVYDNAVGAGVGQLSRVSGEDGYSESYVYDSMGRAIQTTRVLKGERYVVNTSYDVLSRPVTVSYPTSSLHSRLTVKNVYNNLGYMTEVRDAANGSLYHAIEQVDSRGNAIQSSLGNGLTTQRTHNAANGLLSDIKAFNQISGAANPDVQNLHVEFDTIGNLTHRSDSLAQFIENFDYDNSNRLIASHSDFGLGLRTHGVTYDLGGLGNIKTKAGVGAYTYGGACNGVVAGPHAVTSIVGTKNAAYCYDKNGNMISGDGRTISYTLFDKPSAIIKGVNTTRIQYGPSRDLYFRQDVKNNVATNTTFVGAMYERIAHADGKMEERHNVAGIAIVTYTKNADASLEQATRYLHSDHLGSLVAITNAQGVVVERFSFDAWGKRRNTNLADLINLNNPDNWGVLPEALSSTTTNKGFTGHEQLDGVGLIHMGGRVYDADIGRFLSADPFVQDRTNLQALNRYSYVENNPLSFTDPSGYFLKKLLKKAWKFAHAILGGPWRVAKAVLRKIGKVKGLSAVISVALNFIPLCAVWCSMAFNAALAAANGGSFISIAKGAVIGFIASGLPGGESVGGLAGLINGVIEGEVVSIILASGIMAKVQGGKFIDGVKGAVIGMAISAAVKWALTPASASTASPNGPASSTSTQVDGNNTDSYTDQLDIDYGPESSNEIKSLVALEQLMGEDVLKVSVYGNDWRTKLTGTYATTRRNTIYVNDTIEGFFSDAKVVLEEYYHVLRQWNTGRMTRTSYLIENSKNGYANNKYEIEAKGFARDNLKKYQELRGR